MPKRSTTSNASSAQMPAPASFGTEPRGDTPSGDMPIPAMAKPGAADDMPRPSFGAVTAAATIAMAAAATMMPKPSMPEPSSSTPGEMPRPASDAPSTLPRFGPPGGGGGQRHQPAYEPGVVEVQFRQGVVPSIVSASTGAPLQIRAAAETPLDELNRILQQHGLLRAEPTFETTHEQATAAQATAQAQEIDAPHLAHFVTLRFPDNADVHAIAAQLTSLPEVERAAPVPIALPPSAVALAEAPAILPPAGNPLLEPLVGTTDTVVLNPVTGLENQWYIFRCHANQAWGRAAGSNVVIADVDWGCRTSHQDLSPNIERTYNAFDGTTDVTHGGSVFHGTGVAGLTGAAVNGQGIAGFGYGAKLWPIQADSGTGTPLGGNAWARGIDWVRTADSGGRRKVVILEVQTGAFGNYEQVGSVNAAIKTAIAAGVIVCVAAGNGDKDAGLDDSGNPIPDTGSILVGATAYDATQNKRAWFSNYGSRIVVCAPGDSAHDLTCDSASDTAYRNGFSAGPRWGVGWISSDPLAIPTAASRLFVRGSDHAVWHKWQTAPNNGWSGWASLGGWIDMLDVGRNADGRLELFVRGADHAVWHNWQTAPNNGWSGWASLGGWVDRLAVAQNQDGRLEVFARGADGAVWHNWQTAPNNGWSGWASLGGWIDELAVDQNADGRLEVFARGSDRALWHNWQTAPNNGWSNWASLGGWIDIIDVDQNAA